MLNFTLKLIDDKNKEIKFEDKEKKISNRKLFAQKKRKNCKKKLQKKDSMR